MAHIENYQYRWPTSKTLLLQVAHIKNSTTAGGPHKKKLQMQVAYTKTLPMRVSHIKNSTIAGGPHKKLPILEAHIFLATLITYSHHN